MTNLSLFVILFFSVRIFASAGAAPRCDVVLGSKKPSVEEISQFLRSIDESLIQGRKTPTYSDFEALTAIETLLHSATDQAMTETSRKKMQTIYHKIDELLPKGSSAKINVASYGPTGYGLRIAYQKSLMELNKYLPKQMHYKAVILPADTNKEKTKSDGRLMIRYLEARHDELLKKQGYETFGSYQKKLYANSDGSIRKATKIIQKEDELEFAMIRPQGGRFWIEKVGFHNQHVTQSSKGIFNIEGRNSAESTLVGAELEQYRSLDNDLKPKYGLILPAIDSKLPAIRPQYGNDKYFFKKDRVRDRLTFTLGDSLMGLGKSGRPNWSSQVYSPVQWDQVFTPWSRKEMIAPFLVDSYSHEVSLMPVEKTTSLAQRSQDEAGYVELQFWGSLNLDDVHSFAFSQDPPTGAFLAALRARNIKIYSYQNKFEDPENYTPWEEPK